MPNATPSWVVEELLAEAVVHPTLGARRYADALARRGFQLSASGVQKILNRHQLGRRQRVGALAQLTAATTGLVTHDALEGPFGFCHFAARPGDLVALDSFFIGKLKVVGPVWQLTAVDTATRWAICEVFIGPSNAEIAKQFIGRVIRKLRQLGVRVTGVLTDNGPEFIGATFRTHLNDLHITPSPNTTPISELQRSVRTVPRHRAARVLAASIPPPTLRSTHPTPRRARQLARHLQHPAPESQRLHARSHPTPSPRHPPQEPSSMNITNRVQLQPRAVTRKIIAEHLGR